MIRRALVTFADQAALSSVTFGAGLVFVYGGSPEQYALYTLFVGAFFFIATAQNAIVNTPMMVLTPRMSGAEVDAFNRGLLGALLLSVGGVSLTVAVGAMQLARSVAVPWGLAFLVAVCFVPQVLRDHFRAQEYALLRPDAALRRDAVYGAVAIIGILVLYVARWITAASVFAVVSVAALAVCLWPTIEVLRSWPTRGEMRTALSTSWEHSRWSLAGALSSWAQGYTYVFVPFALSGSREVAFLAAARLVLTPVMLLVQSWANYFRPTVSQCLARGDRHRATALLLRGCVALAAMLVVYTAGAICLLYILPIDWIPIHYRGIGPYVALWALVAFIQIVRSNVSSVLQASLEFRRLALWGAATATVTVVATIGLVLGLGGFGAMIGMLVGEVTLALGLVSELARCMRPTETPVVAA